MAVPDASTDSEFVALASRIRGELRLAALAVTLDRGDAEDVTQEALAAAFGRWSEVRALDRPDLWVRRVAVNRAIDLRRRRTRWSRVFGRLAGAAELRAELGETVTFWDAVGRLTPAQQEVVVLRAVQELSVDEIAVALDLPAGTVKSRLHTARGRLAELLADAPLPGTGSTTATGFDRGSEHEGAER